MNNSEILVVTGGSKGIGKAIIEKFASENWSVATCARNLDQLKNLQTEIEAKYGTKLWVFQADLSKKEEAEAFGFFVKSLNQQIGVLVNNSGSFMPGGVHDDKEELLHTMMNSNLFSAYHVTKTLIPLLKTSQKGHIFNICSVASLKAYPNGGAYSVSKFALYGFSQALREELKETGIRVSSVLPGATFTDSWKGSELPQERFMNAKDLANTVFSTYMLSKQTLVEDIILRPQLGDI